MTVLSNTLEEGRVALQSRQFGEARRVFSRLYSEGEQKAALLLARTEFMDGNIAEAQEVLNQYMALKPDSSRAYELQGRIYLAEDEFDQAKQACEKSLQLEPTLASALRLNKDIESAENLKLGDLAFKNNEFEKAGEYFSLALASEPSPRLRFKLAKVDFKKGDLTAAKKALEELIEKNQIPAQAWKLRSQIHLDEKDLNAARAAFEKAKSINPNLPNLQALDRKIEDLEVAETISGLIAKLDSFYPEWLGKDPNEEMLNLAGQLLTYNEGTKWGDDVCQAKVAFIKNCSDLSRALANYDPDLIQKSVEYGYVTWPKRIQKYVKHKKVLDVGCGFGGFGTGFLIAGASEYTGLDPSMDLDSTRAKNKRIRKWASLDKTPREIANNSPDIRLLQGVAEDIDFSETFDLIVMHNVTEHLMQIEQVFSGLVPLCHNETRIIYTHHNYYCWNGHHFMPNQPGQIDYENPKHLEVYDWRHINFLDHLPEDHYFATHLNRIRLGELRRLTEKYFTVVQWDEKLSNDETLSRLNPDIVQRVRTTVPDIEEREMKVNMVFCVAIPR